MLYTMRDDDDTFFFFLSGFQVFSFSCAQRVYMSLKEKPDVVLSGEVVWEKKREGELVCCCCCCNV